MSAIPCHGPNSTIFVHVKQKSNGESNKKYGKNKHTESDRIECAKNWHIKFGSPSNVSHAQTTNA